MDTESGIEYILGIALLWLMCYIRNHKEQISKLNKS